MIQARGVSGELKYGYQVVARLTSWHIGEGGRVEAQASDVNAYWLETGGPFELRLKVGRKFWVWTSVSIAQITPSFVAVVDGQPTTRE